MKTLTLVMLLAICGCQRENVSHSKQSDLDARAYARAYEPAPDAEFSNAMKTLDRCIAQAKWMNETSSNILEAVKGHVLIPAPSPGDLIIRIPGGQTNLEVIQPGWERVWP